MEDKQKTKPKIRARDNKIKNLKYKNLIAIIKNPDNVKNIGTIIRNVNALGVKKVYIVTDQNYCRYYQVNSDLAKNKYFVNEAMRLVDHKFYKNPVFYG